MNCYYPAHRGPNSARRSVAALFASACAAQLIATRDVTLSFALSLVSGVPEEGFEPSCPCEQRILSPLGAVPASPH
jgi:hypothetical protein